MRKNVCLCCMLYNLDLCKAKANCRAGPTQNFMSRKNIRKLSNRTVISAMAMSAFSGQQ